MEPKSKSPRDCNVREATPALRRPQESMRRPATGEAKVSTKKDKAA